jgi:diguanylate cyclase
LTAQFELRQRLLPWLWLLFALVLSSLVWAFVALFGLAQSELFELFEWVAPRFLATFICFRVVAVHSGRARLGWLWLARGLAVYSLGSLLYQGLKVFGFSPFPSVADLVYLLNPPFLMLGFFLFVEGRFHPRERLRLTLDALIIALVISIYIWFALLAPALSAHLARGTLGLPIVLAAFYLVLDLTVLGVLLVCLARWSRVHFVRMGWWFLAGVVFLTVADGYFLARCFLDGLPTSHPIETGWNWWVLCFSVAALQSLRGEVVPAGLGLHWSRWRLRQFGVYSALVVVLPVLLLLPQNSGSLQSLGVQVGIALVLVLVIVRQLVFSLHLEQANFELKDLSVSLEERVQQRTQDLSFRASHDLLTGLANRDVFEQALVSALADSSGVTAVIFMDLDRFKQINDTLGHALGDLALREMALRMQQILPSDAVLARHGGDEFMLLLPNLPVGSAVQTTQVLAEQLLGRVRLPILVEHHELFLDMSIGATFAPINGSTVGVLEQQADAAMYFAKRTGSSYAEFNIEMRTLAVQRLEVEGRLRRDLDSSSKESLWLVYQPIVDLVSRKIVNLEALLRHQLYPTNQLVSIAEESGLMLRLGSWVLEQACTQAAVWAEAGVAIPVSVNVSTVQFERPNFVDVVRDILERTKLAPHLLTLELLENVLVTRFEDTALKIEQLRALGVRFALDDFGTGYSSLAYLHRLPFDTIKIDRSFVQGLGNSASRNSRPLIQAILSIAQAFGAATVVEGVETEIELQILQEMGASLSQGYFFAPPLSVTELEPMLRVGRL